MPRRQLTLGDLKKRTAHWLGGKKIETIAWCANLALEYIAREVGPIDRNTFTTTAPYTTGTVTTTVGDATLTGSSTVWTAALHKGALIQVDGDDTWFNINSVASNTSLELSSVWSETAAASLTYEIAFPLVTLDADVLEILAIGRPGRETLREVTHERSLRMRYDRIDPGEPVAFSRARFKASSGKTVIRLHQPPDDDHVFSYIYVIRPLFYDENNSKSVSDFPDTHNSAIFAGTMAHLFDMESGPERSAIWLAKFNTILAKLKAKRYAGMHVRLGAFRSGGGLVYSQGEIVSA